MKSMKAKISLVTIMALLASIMLSITPVSASLEEMPKDLSRHDSLKEMLNNKNDFEVLVDVDNDKNFSDYLDVSAEIAENQDTSSPANSTFKFKKIKSFKEAKKTKKYTSLWITKDEFDKYLNAEGKKELDKYLDAGNSVYFIGLEDLNILSQLFTNTTSTMELDPSSQAKQRIAFVTKNKNGEYFFGHIVSIKDSYDKDTLSCALSSSWNRRNDHNYTRQQKSKAFSDVLTQKAYAEYGNSFTIGSDWVQRFGWYQVIAPCYFDKGGSMQDHLGDYVEWRGGFYLRNSKDGRDYYAMAFEHGMSPASRSWWQSTVASRYLYLTSHADGYGQRNLLMSYAPKTSPTNSTMTFKVGNNFSSNPSLGSIDATWQVVQSDLSLADSSALADQFMKLTFTYNKNWYGGFTSYAKGTSWQDSCVIYQAPSGTTSCPMLDYHLATFEDSNGKQGSGLVYTVVTLRK